jgi:hypothetical protein
MEAKLTYRPGTARWPVTPVGQISLPAPTAEPAEPTGRRRIIDRQAIGRTVVSALILGVLLHWRWGYTSGFGDHLVLSPRGRQWANPEEFLGDWTIANAPQPHWHFDGVTWFGSTIGQLGAVYLAYWMISLLVFGAATSMLAPRWAPVHPWAATVLVSVLGAITPWWLLGTGSPMIAMALPVVLGGFLLYLAVGALLVERRLVACGAAIATAVVHLQQGAVIGVLLLAVVVVTFARSRRVDWYLLGTGVACLGIVYAALSARPVAGHVKDFAEICAEIIPVHCEATLWSSNQILAGFALVGLAMLSCLYLPVEQRPRWATLVLLPTAGLILGIFADRWNVPTLGTLAQGLNIYRLTVLLLPLAVWGVLTPVFAQLRLWPRLAVLVLVLVLAFRAFGTAEYEPAYPLEQPAGGWFMVLLAAALAIATLAATSRRGSARLLISAGAVGVVVSVVASMSASDTVRWKRFDPRLYQGSDIGAWGEIVRQVVPPGSQLVAAPLATYVRMVTGRAVVADCKYVPFGGPAWHEYVARIDALGGFAQCSALDPAYFNLMPPEQLIDAAQRYGARYLVVEAGQRNWLPTLADHGWTVVVGPVNSLQNWVLEAPPP